MRPQHPALTVTLGIVALGTLAQPTLAGFFIAGVGNLRLAHLLVGTALQWFSLVPMVIALANRSPSGVSRTVRTGTVALVVLIWAQAILGHMPFAVTTIVHVPLGAVLLGWAVALVVASLRPAAPHADQAPR